MKSSRHFLRISPGLRDSELFRINPRPARGLSRAEREKMNLLEVAAKATNLLDDLNPWDFRDVYGYGTEAVDAIARELREEPDGLTQYLQSIANDPDDYDSEDRGRALEILGMIDLLPFKYKLDYSHNGYAIATRNELPVFVKNYREGKYTFVSSYVYAKRYNYKTAKKHLLALEAGETL